MTLREAVDRYVAWQRDHGAKFRSSAETLDTLCRRIGENRDCDTVGEDEVRRFLAGKGVLTRTRAVKYGTLAGFYSFALGRGHVSRTPMPPREAEPRPPEVAPPFIFTHEELQRLFKAAGSGRQALPQTRCRNLPDVPAPALRCRAALRRGTTTDRGGRGPGLRGCSP